MNQIIWIPYTTGWFSEVLGYALHSSTEEVKTSTLQDLQELTSLFVHYYKGDVLEDSPGLVDFTVKLKPNIHNSVDLFRDNFAHF